MAARTTPDAETDDSLTEDEAREILASEPIKRPPDGRRYELVEHPSGAVDLRPVGEGDAVRYKGGFADLLAVMKGGGHSHADPRVFDALEVLAGEGGDGA